MLLRGIIFALLCCFPLVPVRAEGNGLRRQKRDWIEHPRQLKENHDYSGINIGRIRSDKENFTTIFYSLKGPGCDEPPFGVFGVDQRSGFLKAYKVLDREEIAFYDLKGVAKYEDGSRAEKDVDIRITVVDENDNPPIIKIGQVGTVKESCVAGTIVMSVIATDADQEGTISSQIFYSIVETHSTAGMFTIHSKTGDVSVLRNTLDRERKDTYKVVVKASDLNGQPEGNVGMGEIEIRILDINDNVPTLEKESYEGSVEENTVNVEVMRIQAIDLDLEFSDNWLAVFKIISGNEGGYFSITTDAKTNQGIIMIQKELDYEELKSLNLAVVVSNKASYDFGSSSTSTSIVSKSYSVKINVINQKEGPRFQPSVKVVTLSEDHTLISINSVITTYAAIDSDTQKIATNVRYVRYRDDDNWLIVNEKNAEIRLNKLPDRESKFLINGTYYAQIICISQEVSSKTATGTIAIQVEDFNDHCPKVTATSQTMCYDQNFIYVTAADEDEFPNSAPFEFTVISTSSHGKWSVEHLNGTTAILRDQNNLRPGMYKVAVEIKDQQGKSCGDFQMLDVVVCTCEENTKTCKAHIERRSDFGVGGILLLLLGLLLLLLVPLLLLFCLCGGTGGDFKAIPFDTKQQLISYHTECQGEDRVLGFFPDVPLIHITDGEQGIISKGMTLGGKGFLGGLVEGGGALISGNEHSNLTTNNVHMYNEYNQFSGHGRMNVMDGGTMTGQGHFSQYRGGAFDDLAVSDHFLEEYYTSKSNHAAQNIQEIDTALVYNYEGGESLSGSVGCCSLHENDNDFSFLDDLDPKFKTLAEICKGSSQVDADICIHPTVRPVSPVRPSPQKHVQTHTESIRDHDRLHVDTLSTSKVTSGKSRIVQEGSSTLSKVHVQDNVVIPGQTLLVQQPTLYYASAPMYVVEPQSQMVLVAGGAQQGMGQVGLAQGLVQVGQQGVGQVGLAQGLVQVGQQGVGQVGLAQGLVQVGQQGVGQVGLAQGLVQIGGLQGSQGMVLVDGQVGQVAQGTLPRQVLVVENGSTGGGQGAQVAFVQNGQGSGEQTTLSRQVLLVEKGSSGGGAQVTVVQTGRGSSEHGLDVRGQSVQARSFSLASQDSTGSKEDFVLKAKPKSQVGQRVVVQQQRKQVSVTERNIEPLSRA
ncbi:desmoglein-2-like protein isoform X1 [Syngnathus typhle]|uniref:desmoglein-2-like protein isoform X1 n=1 Tax=Syngnathus typhle TaxID=161592 RepID=UPI002A698864|nr:desmoglein-2-like protein isoform X1 [Syngnathus typhle]